MKKISFRGTPPLADVEEHVERSLGRIVSFLDKERAPYTLDFVLEKHPTHGHDAVNFHAQVTYNEAAGSHTFEVHREGNILMKIADEAIDAMYRQILEKKRQLVDERNHPSKPARGE